MKKMLVAVVLLASACGQTWQQKVRFSVDAARATGDAAVIRSISVCEDVKNQCIKDQTNPCPPLDKCLSVAEHISRGYVALMASSVVTLYAVQQGDEQGASERLAVVLKIVQAIREALLAAGIQGL